MFIQVSQPEAYFLEQLQNPLILFQFQQKACPYINRSAAVVPVFSGILFLFPRLFFFFVLFLHVANILFAFVELGTFVENQLVPHAKRYCKTLLQKAVEKRKALFVGLCRFIFLLAPQSFPTYKYLLGIELKFFAIKIYLANYAFSI